MDAIAAWLTSNGGSVGFAGLCTLAIWLILTGRLVPRTSVDALRADWNARLNSKEDQVQDWKGAYFRLLDTVDAQAKQSEVQLELSRTSAHLIQAVATKAREGQP